jgi:hypothetical protein
MTEEAPSLTSPGNQLPPPLRIYQLSAGHCRSSALALVAKLGVADAISSSG